MTILKMWVIEDMVKIMCLIKIHVWEQFLAFIIIDAIVIIFYKATYNTRLAFNLITTEYFDLFYARMLAYLFAIIHCYISEYQSGSKVLRFFDMKIAKILYVNKSWLC